MTKKKDIRLSMPKNITIEHGDVYDECSFNLEKKIL